MLLPKESAHRLLGILAIIGLIHYNPLKIQRFCNGCGAAGETMAIG